jgi:hypothetical protein
MDRQVFKVGPEALEFMGETLPIIDKTTEVIDAHKAAVAEMRTRFLAQVAEAKRKAEAEYAALCEQTAKQLREAA